MGMMKELNRRNFIKGALSLGAISALSGLTGVQARAEGESVYTPGTYTASAMGRDGQVTVHVTFDEKSIIEVSVDASAETENIGGIAAPILEEQVMKAQSSAIDGVSSATITSQAVKKAVADCIFEASGGKIVEGGDIAVKEDIPPVGGAANIDWLGTAPEIDESQITETFETEVLVVGAGNSGLMTAARAAVGGAKVLVIEKAISSQTERHWIGAVGTKEQEASGTVIDKNKLVAELAKYASHRCDEKLIRLWADHSAEAIGWYAEQVKKYNPNVEFHHEWDVGHGDHDTYYCPPTMHNFQDDDPEHDYSQKTAAYGLDTLTKVVTDNGGEIWYETPMIKLEQDESGRVTGVIAQNKDGDYIRIHSEKGVALCCGGYPSNKEMMSMLNPDAYSVIVSSVASVNDVGDGIKAAMWIGADKDPDPTAMLFDRGLLTPDRLPDGDWSKSGPFHIGSQPWLKVNLKGERFSNESVPYDFIIHAGYMEPGHVYCTIYDSNWLEHVRQFHQFGCARVIPSDSGGKLQIFSPEVDAGLLKAMEQAGFIQKADTIEELAEKLNLPVDTFVATVKRYNELCEKGEDEDFGKEAYRMIALDTPPFYGTRQGAQLLCTLDGLRINTKMQVLDKNGDVIEGLYAAGDCSGGFFAHNYPEYIVGVAVGRTLTEGYLLGDQLAGK